VENVIRAVAGSQQRSGQRAAPAHPQVGIARDDDANLFLRGERAQR
jgi:hypothetical protein